MCLLKVTDRQDLDTNNGGILTLLPELSFGIIRQNYSALPLPLGQGICIFS